MSDDPRDPIYTASDMIRVMECNRIFYNGWVARGLLKPSIPSKGAGNPSRWSLNDILAAKITKILGGAGFNLRVAKGWAQEAVDHGGVWVHPIAPNDALVLRLDVPEIRKKVINTLTP